MQSYFPNGLAFRNNTLLVHFCRYHQMFWQLFLEEVFYESIAQTFLTYFSVNCCLWLQKTEYFHLVSVYKILKNNRRSSYVETFAAEIENNADDFL